MKLTIEGEEEIIQYIMFRDKKGKIDFSDCYVTFNSMSKSLIRVMGHQEYKVHKESGDLNKEKESLIKVMEYICKEYRKKEEGTTYDNKKAFLVDVEEDRVKKMNEGVE